MLVVLAAVHAGPRLLAYARDSDLPGFMPPFNPSPLPAARSPVPAPSDVASGSEEEVGGGVGFSGCGVDEDGKDRLMAMVHDAATKRMASGQLGE